MLSNNIVQKGYPGDNKMRSVTKVVRTQYSVNVGEVTEKEFNVATKKRRICKDITTFYLHAENSGFVKETLEMCMVRY